MPVRPAFADGCSWVETMGGDRTQRVAAMAQILFGIEADSLWVGDVDREGN